MELICPAGTPAAFREAVKAGADAVYCGFRNETNARNFPGLNFTPEELGEAVAFAGKRNVKTFVAINTFMRAGDEQLWRDAVAAAHAAGADAVIVADLGLMAFVAKEYPDLRLHVSVQAGASNADAVNYLVAAFDAKRVVLPRVLTIKEVKELTRAVRCETEVFAFGGLCVMEEGRCSLSSYAVGESPNMNGVCSPARHVGYREESGALFSTLGRFTINRFAEGEAAGYPTLCKGRFMVDGVAGYVFEDPTSLNAVRHLDALREAGVAALKIEGRQRGKAYVAEVVATLKRAMSADEGQLEVCAERLRSLSEGQKTTSGAFEKRWR